MEFNSVDFFCCIDKMPSANSYCNSAGYLGISDQNLSREAEYSDRCLSCLFQSTQTVAVR